MISAITRSQDGDHSSSNALRWGLTARKKAPGEEGRLRWRTTAPVDEDAEVHCLGATLDAVVVGVQFVVESHGFPPNGLSSTPRLPGNRVASGRAFMSIRPVQMDAASRRR